ncbi:MAG: YfhO family protein [Candidatus Hydrogenedentes bacterium]|nr:YfhO family protein [Candidatus Hydrogenedentota bacterium]
MRVRSLSQYVIQAALLVAALVPIYPGVFLRGEILLPIDNLYEVPPWFAHRPADPGYENPTAAEATVAAAAWYSLTDAAFDRGEVPLWNPYQFTGAPLLGDMQTAVFYPPRLLFRLVGDTYVAMTVYFLLRLWLCGFNAFIAARILGLRVPFANLYSILFMLAGYNLHWTFYPPPDVMAWLPLLFAGVESILIGRYRTGVALTVVSATMGILAAHPSTLLLGCIGILLYALLRLATSRPTLRHIALSASSALVAFVMAFALAAVQVLPFAEYLPHAARLTNMAGSRPLESYRYSIFDLLCLWGGRMRGTGWDQNLWGTNPHTYIGMLYLGMTAWVCLSLLTRRPIADPLFRLRTRVLLVVSFICFYCATEFPLAPIVHALPVIRESRPAYFLAFPTLALPLCAVVALQAWIDARPSTRDLRTPAISIAVLGLLIGAIAVSAPYLSLEYATIISEGADLGTYTVTQYGIAVALACAAFLLLAQCVRHPNRTGTVAGALCVLAILDQAQAMRGVIPSNPRSYMAPRTQVTEFLRAIPPPCRVRFDPCGARSGYPALYSIEEYGGYDAIFPIRFKRFYDSLDFTPGSTADALLSCDYTLFAQGQPLPAAYRPVFEAEGTIVAERTDPIPRARLVDAVVVFPSTEAMFDAMKQPDFNPRGTAYTDSATDFDLPELDDTPTGEAVIEEWRSQLVRIRAHAQKECALVLADAYFPGWEATVDGAPATIFPAYHLFRGVHVPQGEHIIEFTYRPASFRYGLFISFVALAIACPVALLLLVRQRGTVTLIQT